MAEATGVETQTRDMRQLFVEKAEAAAAIVTEVADFEGACEYAMDLCGSRGACRIRVSGCEEHLSEAAGALCETKHDKIIAAPGLDPEQFAALRSRCEAGGFDCIRSGMHAQLAGIDIGFTYADAGIAETGTLVLNCPGEELRLATMLCEYHVCLLRTSDIVADAFAAENRLLKFMRRTPNYTAFITGPSRTADIERVLTIGVHGPLELHILLLEG